MISLSRYIFIQDDYFISVTQKSKSQLLWSLSLCSALFTAQLLSLLLYGLAYAKIEMASNLIKSVKKQTKKINTMRLQLLKSL